MICHYLSFVHVNIRFLLIFYLLNCQVNCLNLIVVDDDVVNYVLFVYLIN